MNWYYAWNTEGARRPIGSEMKLTDAISAAKATIRKLYGNSCDRSFTLIRDEGDGHETFFPGLSMITE